MGSGGVSDGYNEGSSKRPRMTESNPYFAVTGSGSSASDYDATSKRPRMIDPNPYFGSLATTSFYQPFSSSTFAGGGSGSLYNFPVVRLRGLPFNCDDVDIFKFFAGACSRFSSVWF